MTHALSMVSWGIEKGVVLSTLLSPSVISIFMIEMVLFTFSFNTWVFDTGCGNHICNSLHGFRKHRELKIDEMVLHVGNGAWVAVQAI
uniref:Uncharacterized protein n=1 Tax=Lactuca sativa TaxID=4236 RepID=A0A9R1UI42_LACSA|nr:hypothetical protein LSAT_V11C900461410 [Lactuca sativa]